MIATINKDETRSKMNAGPEKNPMMKLKTLIVPGLGGVRRYGLLIGVLLILGALYGWAIQPGVTGYLFDDAVYLLTAKALATGHGYVALDLVGSPALVKYPPLFPLVLAPLWMITPGFPGNILAFKLLNLSLLFGFFAGFYAYGTKVRALPGWLMGLLLLVLGTQVNWLETAVALMSEPLYLLLNLALVALAIRAPEKNKEAWDWRWLLGLVGLSLALFYTRTLGALAMMSLAGWLAWYFQPDFQGAFPARAWRWYGGWYIGLCTLGCLPWLLWTQIYEKTAVLTNIPLGRFVLRSFAEPYWQSLQMDLRYEKDFAAIYAQGLGELATRFSLAFFPGLTDWPLLGFGLSVLLVFLLLKTVGQALQEKKLSFLGVYTTLYLVLLPCWNFIDQYPRFLLVILPYCWLFLLERLRHRWSLAVAVLLVALLSNGWLLVMEKGLFQKPFGANTLALSKPLEPATLDLWQEYQAVFPAIARLPHGRFWTDDMDAHFYGLYTGQTFLENFVQLPVQYLQGASLRKISPLSTSGQAAVLIQQKALFQEKADALYAFLRRYRVRYVITNPLTVTTRGYHNGRLIRKADPSTALLLQKYAAAFLPILSSPHHVITVYAFLDD